MINKSKIYANVVSVSRTGMSRKIKFYQVQDGCIRSITEELAELTGFKLDKGWALEVKGCGMDMIWHVLDVAHRQNEDININYINL